MAFCLILLGIHLSTAVAGEIYDKGEIVGTIPSAFSLSSSLNYADRLYGLQNFNKLVIIKKQTGKAVGTLEISAEQENLSMVSLTVSSCSTEDDGKNCIFISALSSNGIQLLRLEEPDQNTTGKISVEHLEVHIPEGKIISNLHVVTDESATAWIIYRENNSYRSIKILENAWKEKKITVEIVKVVLQQDFVFISMDVDINGNIVVVSEDGVPYIYNNPEENFDLPRVIQGKPHKLELRPGKHHKIQEVFFDQHDASLYALTKGKHQSLVVFRAPQSDQALSQCLDKNIHCKAWKSHGMCSKRKDYMTITCPWSCNTCQESNRLSQFPLCIDRHHLCSIWAGQGQCKGQSREYMSYNCRRSCNICLGSDTPSTICQDAHKACSSWSKSGMCDTRPDFMLQNCPASCGRCDSTGNVQNDQGSESSPAAANCQDRNEFCTSWADSGKCESRKDFMYISCASSCGLCGTKAPSAKQEAGASEKLYLESEKCSDSSKFCRVWEAHGMCDTKKVYMSFSCKLSCELCHPVNTPKKADRCDDLYEDCQTWSKYGLCAMKADFMSENCPNSCNRCLNGRWKPEDNRVIQEKEKEYEEREQQKSKAPCTDNNSHCPLWASNQYCTSHRDFMAENCRASCKICTTSERAVVKEEEDQENEEEDNNNAAAITQRPETETPKSTESTPSVTILCKDTTESCVRWKEAGFCTTRPDAMNRYCPESCGFCKSQSFATATPATTTGKKTIFEVQPTTPTRQTATEALTRTPVRNVTICKDFNELCTVWKTSGACQTRKDYMDVTCPLSCGKCVISVTSPNEACQDQHQLCSTWANDNRCKTYTGYMAANCPKSCGICTATTDQFSKGIVYSTSTLSPSACSNQNSYCDVWAGKGLCKVRGEYMSRMCKKACNLC